MAKQAKCTKCKVRYVWKREHPLGRSFCVKCGERLKGTTHILAWPVRDLGHVKPYFKDPRFREMGDGTASVWWAEKNKLCRIPWKKGVDTHQKRV